MSLFVLNRQKDESTFQRHRGALGSKIFDRELKRGTKEWADNERAKRQKRFKDLQDEAKLQTKEEIFKVQARLNSQIKNDRVESWRHDVANAGGRSGTKK